MLGDHPLPEDCDDRDCPRFPCVMFKRGFADGHGAGSAAWLCGAGLSDGLARQPVTPQGHAGWRSLGQRDGDPC